MSALARPNDPEPSALAGYILALNAPPGTYIAPGSFYASLVDTFMLADRPNRLRLAEGFPLLADMVNAYKDDYDGTERLRATAAGAEWDR